MTEDTAWRVYGTARFVDRRQILSTTLSDGTRREGHVRNVRAYRAVIGRRRNGKQEYDRCPHAHSKQSAARKCAERAARILTRNGGEWPS
jgi:hypothetical protein